VEALRQIKDWFSKRSTPKREPITSDDAGFAIGSRRIAWRQIASVAAFKRDMVTLDDV